MIEIKELSKSYNGKCVLHLPLLHIRAGETVGLVGNNGAGKTTLFRLILDLICPDTGMVSVNGKEVKGREEWKSIVGAFLEESFLIDFLTADEYFKFVGKLHDLNNEDMQLFKEAVEPLFAGELSQSNKLIREYSTGNRKKIGIAAALIGRPKLLILDEPFTALDPSSQIRLKKLLNEWSELYGMTTFISSHDLNHITEVSKRIIVLNDGEMVRDLDTTDETLHELENYFGN